MWSPHWLLYCWPATPKIGRVAELWGWVCLLGYSQSIRCSNRGSRRCERRCFFKRNSRHRGGFRRGDRLGWNQWERSENFSDLCTIRIRGFLCYQAFSMNLRWRAVIAIGPDTANITQLGPPIVDSELRSMGKGLSPSRWHKNLDQMCAHMQPGTKKTVTMAVLDQSLSAGFAQSNW